MIDIKNLKLSFGEKIIFKNLNLQIQDNARIGIVGANGAGKTTLLKVLTGEIQPDDGIIERSKNLTLGYLPQDLIELEPVPLIQYLKNKAEISKIESKLRDIEEKLSQSNENQNQEFLLNEHSKLERRFELSGGFEFEAIAMKVLHGLGFVKGDENKNCHDFSGGWKMRIAMAALLLSPSDVLLLDEPTNHLDTESMEWLEGWLRTHKGAVVAVSHDQRFLENIAENIADLEHGVINLYPCSYDEYLEAKEQKQELLEKAFAQQQNKIQKIESFITRFRYKATKAAQVQSRLKQLEKIERIELNSHDKTIKIKIPEAPPSGWEVIKANNVSKFYGSLKVFENVNFVINRGERVALVGVNGAGKSTLLRLLSFNEEPTSGNIKLGHNVKFSYYSQESAMNINYSNTVWEEARSVSSKLNDVERRNLLGAFLFSGDDIYKSASVLSGGEKARLALYKLMLEETNFLILDEPTNHLDFNTREIVERALLKYQGTLLIVSHDRHFLDALAERVLEIRDGILYDYPGNYSWFLEKREETLSNLSVDKSTSPLRKGRLGESCTTCLSACGEGNRFSGGGVKQRGKNNNEIKATKKLISQLENKISDSESKLNDIDKSLCDPEVLKDSQKIKNLVNERKNLELEIQNLYSQWEELNLKLENQN
ncbi:MAG: ABC-F family ATP-binding cassette domain-containing protein [Synergistaceae bacterium]|nr:ABC-F family ATP-binding cassette domain-containing protein [Synergistaceae bacterium]